MSRNQSVAVESAETRDRRVLTAATLRAAELLDISQATLARVLGVSPSTVSRMRQHAYQLEPGRKEWEFARLFVRMFRSLDSIVGGREADAKAWMHSENRALQKAPIELIVSVSGLIHVVDYLDASRAPA